jgi:hypothetical protein
MGFRGKSFGPVIIYRAEDYLQTADGGLLCVCLMLLVDGDGVKREIFRPGNYLPGRRLFADGWGPVVCLSDASGGWGWGLEGIISAR